jgi:hypothetical protein
VNDYESDSISDDDDNQQPAIGNGMKAMRTFNDRVEFSNSQRQYASSTMRSSLSQANFALQKQSSSGSIKLLNNGNNVVTTENAAAESLQPQAQMNNFFVTKPNKEGKKYQYGNLM